VSIPDPEPRNEEQDMGSVFKAAMRSALQGVADETGFELQFSPLRHVTDDCCSVYVLALDRERMERLWPEGCEPE